MSSILVEGIDKLHTRLNNGQSSRNNISLKLQGEIKPSDDGDVSCSKNIL